MPRCSRLSRRTSQISPRCCTSTSIRIRNRKRLIFSGVVFLLIGLAVLLYGRLRPDPKVARARELGKQLADRSLSGDQRSELAKQFRDEMGNLSPAQRGELFKDRRKA